MPHLRPTVRAALSILATGALLIMCSAQPALAGPRPRVGPHQVFEGLVNGNRGTSGPVTIFVGCHDPSQVTGHPVGGTVEILPAASTADPDAGNTGASATEIEVFFGAPPPATATPATRSTVGFHKYAIIRAIPKHLELPCSGTGQVTFLPFPRSVPTSRPAVVPVQYLPQP